jgi:hypothetical protein
MVAFILEKEELKEYRTMERSKKNLLQMLQAVSLQEELFLIELNKKYHIEKYSRLSIDRSTGEVETLDEATK